MVFTVLAAADLFGAKLNYELDFLTRPGLQQLRDHIAHVFGAEAALRRPADVPAEPFAIYRLQLYDEQGECWVDVTRATIVQLLDYTQVYCFQREGPYHKEVQSKIPPPVKAPCTAPSPASPSALAALANPAALAAAASMSPLRDSLSASPCPNPTPIPAQPVCASPLAAHAVHMAAAAAPSVSYGAAEHLAALTAEAEFEDKLRCVFDEIDVGRRGRVDREDWRAAFGRVELEHCQDSLFTKADVHRVGTLALTDLSSFARLYPTVLDSLYYRHRDYWLMKKQTEAIEVAEQAVEVVKASEAEAQASLRQATEDSIAQESAVRQQEVAVEAARGRERDALALVHATAQETERCKSRIDADGVDLLACKDRVVRAETDIAAARSDIEVTAVKQRAAQDDRTAAAERLEELLRLVDHQRHALEEAEAREAAARQEHADITAAFAAKNAAREETEAQMQLCKDRMTVSEEQLLQAQERQRAHQIDHHTACQHTATAVLEKDAAVRVHQALVDSLQQGKAALDAATMSVEAQTRAAHSVRAELVSFEAASRAARAQEQTLIEQELRLREARDALDQEEARLRSDHRNFNTSTRAALPSPLHALHSLSATPLP